MTRLLNAALAGFLALGLCGSVLAMTPDEAGIAIRQQAAEKGLEAKDVSQAVSTLKQLIARGVPVEHAYDVVNAAINDGVHGTELAAIARSTPSQAQAEMKSDIASPTRGEFGRNGGGRDFGGSGMGMGTAMGGRRP